MAKIKVKVAKELKKEAKDVCEDIKLSLETTINVFLLKLVEEKHIPFEVDEDLIRSAEKRTFPPEDQEEKEEKQDKKDKKDKKNGNDEDEDPALNDLESLGETAKKEKDN